MSRKDWRRPELTSLDDNLKRIKLVVSYDGSAFHGWQSQDNAVSVQQTILDALKQMGIDTILQGSGRTDSGVHALHQVCHFDIPKDNKIPPERFAIALNTILPKTVKVISSEEVDGTFHARFTTMAREYNYYAKAINDALPFDEGYVGLFKKLPSLELLNQYATVLRGTHDFTTFSAARDESPSKYRDIYESSWKEEYDRFGKRVLVYKVVGNAFLYHQVRSMVGTMIQAGNKGEDIDTFKARLDCCLRSNALTTAPSDGLYLARITYDENEYAWFEEECKDE